MKSIKLMVLLAVVVAVSCKKNDETYNVEYREYFYSLYLSFQDAAGNDLVKGIGFQSFGNDTEDESDRGAVKSDLYTSEVVFPNHWQSQSLRHREVHFVKGKALKKAYPALKYSDYDYLSFMVYGLAVQYYYGIVVRVPFAEKITFKLKCPYIFGDEVEHELVTWWKEKTKEEERYSIALCYRIELGGKEFTEINYSDDGYVSMATVVWESK